MAWAFGLCLNLSGSSVLFLIPVPISLVQVLGNRMGKSVNLLCSIYTRGKSPLINEGLLQSFIEPQLGLLGSFLCELHLRHAP